MVADTSRMLRINHSIAIPESDIEFTFARSGGPGGQNVNKVNSKAVLRWRVTGSAHLPHGVRTRFVERFHNRITTDGDLVLHSQKYRDQGRNVADCLDRLREMILSVVAPPIKRRPTKPSKRARQRRLDSKRRNSEKKQSRRKPQSGD